MVLHKNYVQHDFLIPKAVPYVGVTTFKKVVVITNNLQLTEE